MAAGYVLYLGYRVHARAFIVLGLLLGAGIVLALPLALSRTIPSLMVPFCGAYSHVLLRSGKVSAEYFVAASVGMLCVLDPLAGFTWASIWAAMVVVAIVVAKRAAASISAPVLKGIALIPALV